MYYLKRRIVAITVAVIALNLEFNPIVNQICSTTMKKILSLRRIVVEIAVEVVADAAASTQIRGRVRSKVVNRVFSK
jgi:hypothetical protein